MRLRTKWLLVSILGGILVTTAFVVVPDSWTDELMFGWYNPLIDHVLQVVFWPVTLCVYLAGPGAPIGPPEKHMYEGTPVQILAGFLGIGLSWTFYSSLVFLLIWWRGKRTKSQARRKVDPQPAK